MKIPDLIQVCLLCLMSIIVLASQQAVAAAPHPYEAAGTGYFRDGDTLPGAYLQYRQSSEYGGSLWGLGPGGGNVKRSSFWADAHSGVDSYMLRSCASCHEDQRYSLHSSRGNVTCVQCHRGQPISGINHYYSGMNPIRRHAYVCAKCHEAASASFATYVIHEPPPLASSTVEEFPLFYYAVLFMMILAVGVFALFIPYVTLWGLRELIGLFTERRNTDV
ncbi:MAG: hypothetical protein HKP55_10780 [Gammaproteobacteria bacterium]|nr:hypothetical protein [Gammaproteobacteria bacterium]